MTQDPYGQPAHGGTASQPGQQPGAWDATPWPDPYAASESSYPGYPASSPASSMEPYPAYQPTGIQPQPYSLGAATHPNATIILVMGILGILGIPITGLIAWVLGNKARREIREQPGRYREEPTLAVGWVLGIISTAIWALTLLSVVAFLVLGIALSSHG